MPLSNINFVGQCTWSESGATNAFGTPTQGGSMLYTSQGLSVTTWNQLYAVSFTLATTANTTFDLTSLTNFVCESFAFAHVWGIMIMPVGGNITIGPGASNGLQWFWDDATATTQVNDGGAFLWADKPSATGQVVDGSHKTLKVTNLNGSGSVVTQINILGRTT